MKIEDLIKKAGGEVQLAAALNISQAAVFQWTKRRTGVPKKHWETLVSKYKVTLQDLYSTNENRRSKKSN